MKALYGVAVFIQVGAIVLAVIAFLRNRGQREWAVGAAALPESAPAVLLSPEVFLHAVGAVVTIEGSLSSKPLSTFATLFYSNPAGPPQGKKFLGLVSVITDAAGFVRFTSPFTIALPLGDLITATVIDSMTKTSKFSIVRTVS